MTRKLEDERDRAAVLFSTTSFPACCTFAHVRTRLSCLLQVHTQTRGGRGDNRDSVKEQTSPGCPYNNRSLPGPGQPSSAATGVHSRSPAAAPQALGPERRVPPRAGGGAEHSRPAAEPGPAPEGL